MKYWQWLEIVHLTLALEVGAEGVSLRFCLLAGPADSRCGFSVTMLCVGKPTCMFFVFSLEILRKGPLNLWEPCVLQSWGLAQGRAVNLRFAGCSRRAAEAPGTVPAAELWWRCAQGPCTCSKRSTEPEVRRHCPRAFALSTRPKPPPFFNILTQGLPNSLSYSYWT